jgi:outer membrane protein OmpA-like peptidoglycan-associated protein
MTTTRSQDNEVASDQDSRAAGEAIYFDFDSALLRNDARPELQKVAQEAKRAKAIRIEGNCDERGTTERAHTPPPVSSSASLPAS